MRAKTSELLLAASSARTAVTENMQTNSGAGATNIQAPGAAGKISAATIAADTGIVTINGKDTEFAGTTVVAVLTPSWNATAATATWSCTVTPAKLEPASCRQD